MMARSQLPLRHFIGLTFIGACSLACGGSGGSTGPDPSTNGAAAAPAGDPSRGTRVAGGTTSDFTGDPTLCSPARMEPVDAPQLSMAELLASDTGDFRVPIRWESLCNDPALAGVAGCSDTSAGFHALDGVETGVLISTLYDGSPATVTYETDAEPGCEPTRSVPYMIRLRSLDGLLDETVAGRAGGCNASTGLGFRLPVRDITGGLGDAAVGFSDDYEVQVTAGFFDDRMWFDLHVVNVNGNEPAIFSIDLPPYGVQTHDVPTASVLPSAPLAPGHCGPSPEAL